jgi:hypothetical protein
MHDDAMRVGGWAVRLRRWFAINKYTGISVELFFAFFYNYGHDILCSNFKFYTPC